MTNLGITVGPQKGDAFENHVRLASAVVDRLARSFEEADAAFRQALDRHQITTEKEIMNPLAQTDVANLRESIRATVTHLSGKTVPEAETALQKHLEFLLAQERALFTTGVAVQKPDAPWYPDDSGKWVEVPPGTRALPPGLDPNCLSEVLTSTERRTATYIGRAYPSKSWSWHGGQIVAYKIVAPAAKDDPWYPDDSGKWVEVPPGSGWPMGLEPARLIEVLTSEERRAKTYATWARPAGSWYWLPSGGGTAVAYKTVD